MTHKKYSLIIFAIALLWAPSVWAAPDDLIVEFQNTPLFNEANFLPGSEVSRWTKVKNNTAGAKSIIVEAINESDPNGLAGVFEIGIYEGGIQRYGTTTLAAFFAAGEISLSNLAGGGAQTQYDFLVRFVPGANNSYQEKSLGFDILIGFKGDEGGGDGGGGGGGNGGNGSSGGNGGGGGGGNGPVAQGLVIQNESAVIVTETTATIIWNTSFKSTSRVVYGTITGVFNFGLPPNYGYPFSTPEFDTPANPNGVALHSVTLTGLAPATTYYFRTISHASPDTISKEVSFTTAESRSVDESNSPSSRSNISSRPDKTLSPETLAATKKSVQTQSGAASSVFENTLDINNAEGLSSDEIQQVASDNNANLLVAGLFGLNLNVWWSLLLLLLLLIIYFIYNRYKLGKK